MKYLRNLSLKQIQGKTCLLRVDLNISSDPNLRIHSNLRIEGILPTIKFLINNGAKVVILSHRGRPQKTKNLKLKTKNYSLKPFVKILSQLLGERVDFAEKIKTLSTGRILLLENLRFFPAEEKNDKQFAKKLASLGDIYVNDAFAVSHRENASIAAITRFLPSYAGLLLEKEIENLDSVMKNFKKPLIIVLGGAKISDKIGLIKYFLGKADYFLLGGAIANTFFASQGLPVGDSLFEEKMIPMARKFLKSEKIILPIDLVIDKRKILDIGPETIKKYGKFIKKAKTIIWNGPMGYFENPKFARGTEEIVRILLKNKKAKIVIGGGETVAAFQAVISNFEFRISNLFISTGGGAMLEYLAGKKLPGIQALS